MNIRGKKISFLLTVKKVLLLVFLEFMAIIFHNIFYAIFGVEEAVFFAIAVIVLPVYFVISLIVTLTAYVKSLIRS